MTTHEQQLRMLNTTNLLIEHLQDWQEVIKTYPDVVTMHEISDDMFRVLTAINKFFIADAIANYLRRSN